MMMNDVVVAFEGTIYEDGYGMIAQKVMRDKDIPAKSKAIYAYLCAFAGSISKGSANDREAFPGVKLMMEELDIRTDDTFYKFRKPLIDKGYLKVRQEKENGKFARNIYSIIAVPAPFKAAPEQGSAPSPKNSGTDEKPSSKNSGSAVSGSKKWRIKSNSSLKLSVFKNNISSSSSRESIDFELMKKYPDVPFNEVHDQLLSDGAVIIETDRQYKSMLEYRLKNWKPKQKRQTTSTRKTVRKEVLPDWFDQPAQTETAAIADIEKQRLIREKLRAFRGE